MCLGVPGMVTKIEPAEHGMTMGTVNFAGITKEVCLACVPDVKVGDYVIVHVGFALARVDEREALEVFEALRQMGELAELDVPQPGGPGDAGAEPVRAGPAPGGAPHGAKGPGG